mmetsp:Transcript_8506/g.13074  ORF Transcript_8506/g.13074 Transcript_8506/m.13074 type:complete len:123 (-) Transcript_8506:689-1057(-)
MDNERVIMYEFEKQKDDPAQDARMARISKRFLFVQSALLYSSSDGQRRIRCHNLALPITNSLHDCFENIDIVTTTALLARKALSRFSKMPNIEQSRSMVEASLNNLCKANQRHARLEKGEQF